VIEQDCYIADIELASRLPPVWLENPASDAHLQILEKAKGGVTIRGHMDDSKHPFAIAQMFVLFLVELDS
jgi:hypothetical protein